MIGTIDSSAKPSMERNEPLVGCSALPVVSPVAVSGSGVKPPPSMRPIVPIDSAMSPPHGVLNSGPPACASAICCSL